jgi:hypothetical protein
MIPVLAGLLLGSALLSGCASTGAESRLAAGPAAEASASLNQTAQPRSSQRRFNALGRGVLRPPVVMAATWEDVRATSARTMSAMVSSQHF